ncbi:Sulfite efflux pump SSU1 [Candida viswanathii]|uniref:Sulfite efflux pump SSU1 n=1 Tax=Candida viswanathii TaxID=5486 RepID=A0A367YK17_9ASCO|nr:Sulfite efflux pump SSU1 [Candida viswanathii]
MENHTLQSATPRDDRTSAMSVVATLTDEHHQQHQPCDDEDTVTLNYQSAIASVNSKEEEEESPYTQSFYQRVIVNDVVKNFGPAYFVSVMGTGISSSLLYNFPYPAHWLEICGYIMFGITCILFLVNVALFIMSCYYYKGRFTMYNVNPAHLVFMGCFSMGYITIVNFIHIITKGKHVYLVWTLWWIAVASAMYTAFIVVYFSYMSKLNEVDVDAKLNASLLLPIVSITVVSSSGHMIELGLHTLNQTVITMLVSFMLWCLSISLALMIITIYLWRLIVHKIPNTQLVITGFLPVGFLGQSSYSVYLFGTNLNKLIPEDLLYGKILLCICGFFCMFLLCLGYFMLFVAVVSILSKIKPFAKTPHPDHTNKYGLLKLNKGFWGMTFPLGTMSLSNTIVGEGEVGNYPLLTFKIMGCIFAVACIVVTTCCCAGVVVYCIKKLRQDFINRYKRNNHCIV